MAGIGKTRDAQLSDEALRASGDRFRALVTEQGNFKGLLRRTVIVPVVALAILAAVLLWENNSLDSSLQWVNHTDQVIGASQQLIKLIIDMDSGVRGYLSSGNEEFLRSYNEAKTSIDPKFDAINQLVSDNPPQQTRLAVIRSRFDEWRSYQEGRAELRRSTGSRVEPNLRSKQLMDAVRTEHDAFIATEERLRTERVRRARNASELVTLTCALLTLCVGVFLAVFTRRQLHLLGVCFQESLDISEKGAEALRSSQARLQGIISSAMDAVISVDEDQRIVVFNRAAEAAFQCPASEALGSTLDRFIPKALREAHREHIRRFGTQGETSRSMNSPAILSAVRSNGEEFPIEATISHLQSEGKHVYTVILRDITARVLAEQALIRSEKLASVGRMAAAVAHEINNPLGAVTNLLYLAKSVDELPDSARKYLEVADEELKRIAHITQQSLGFYHESTAPARTSVHAILQSAVDMLSSKIKAKQAVVETQGDENVEIIAVAGELRQVFSNLLANSLDAIGDKGIIKLRVSTGAALDNAHRCVRVTIADNGKGISASLRRQIFEPFVTTKGATGTGLGLWVSKQIIDKHAGRIRVRSNTDGTRGGTVFSVTLPIAPAAGGHSAGA